MLTVSTPSTMIVHVLIKTVYGETKFYPACDKAEVFAAIAGTKTLTQQTINQIKALGYTMQACNQIVDI